MNYLVRRNKNGHPDPTRPAHYWTGNDTYCRQASTGGLNQRRFVVLSAPLEGQQTCSMCLSVKLKGDNDAYRP